MEGGGASLRRLSAPPRRGARTAPSRSRRTISAGAITASSTSHRPRTATCAACASRTGSSSTGSFPRSPGSPKRLAGGYAHVTTRANLQIREIMPENGPAVVEQLLEAGIVTKGAGADNVRNVTGSATAGIDPVELIDTRPHARAWHHHILNTRALYGLPRKFNVAFDGGGAVATLEETNDIGFQAVAVKAGAPVEAGVWYRLDPRRHHRPQGLCPRHRGDPAARRCDAGCRRDRARLHRAWRPHQPPEGTPQISPRLLGLRQIPGRGREEARRLPAEARCVVRRAASARPTVMATSASTGRSSRGSTGSASSCRSAS